MLSTRPGWLERAEVVEVRFDPSRVSYETLVRHAQKRRCISPVFTRTAAHQAIAKKIVGGAARRSDGSIRWVKDDKYQMSRTHLRFVPMSRMQATRVNANVRRAEEWLSPRQKRLLALVRQHPRAGWPNQIGTEFRLGWKKAEAVASKLK